MRCLIQTITVRQRRDITHPVRYEDTDRVTIGRGTSQTIELPDLAVALEHAEINLGADGSPWVHARTASPVWINDQPRQNGRLAPEDRLVIGANVLTVREAPEGFDLALKVEIGKLGKGGAETFAASSRIGLERTGLRKRPWAWGLFLVILALFAALPAGGFFAEELQAQLRKLVFPSDRSWDTGALARAHRIHDLDVRCDQCHQEPFVRVQDRACVGCHRDTPHHVSDPQAFPGRSTRCATCHHEHNEPSSLIPRDDRLCVTCHKAAVAEGEVLAVSSLEGHPQFRVSLPRWTDGTASLERVSLDAPRAPDGPLQERSGLEFSHHAHLRRGDEPGEGVCALALDECRVGCVDCHRLQPEGRSIHAVDAETMCLDCHPHRLSFDKRDPDRTAPHGDAKAVVETLREYYAGRALEGGYRDPDAPEVVRRRRLPGEVLTEAEVADALRWSEQRWRRAADELFETRCALCHSVDRGDEDPRGWKIAPVRVTSPWMPRAVFDHGEHLTGEGEVTAQCTSCHAVEESKESADVAMPGVETCRECHGDEPTRHKVASACIDCHRFHVSGHVQMAERR